MKHRKFGLVSAALGIVKNRKVIALAASVAVAGGLAAAASGATGAFFSDTQSGTITGTVGQIKVEGAGDLAFNNLLPGEPQTVTADFKNTGSANQDVWVVFNNPDALHAINDLGTYGEVHLTANGVDLFDSANLNDGLFPASPSSCSAHPTGSQVALSPTGCWPLAREYMLASNVAPNGTGSMKFTFMYAGKLGKGTTGGGIFNQYPVADQGSTPIAPSTSVSSGNGLPYQIVATQVGQTPGS